MSGYERHARLIARVSIGFAMLVAAPLARSQQCTITTTSVAFGAYDTFAAVSLDSNGSVSVSCDVPTGYSLTMDTGGSGTFNRAMASGPNRLAYGLFTDATRSVVWGNGTGATSRVNGSGLGTTHIVYGRVPARQNVRAGSYADALVVTVEF